MRRSVGWLLLAMVAGYGCSGEGAPSEEAATEQAAEAADATESADTVPAPALHAFTMDDARRAPPQTSFPHTPHVGVDCATCHSLPPGHAEHVATVPCGDCHQAAQTPMRPFTREECQSCHHDPNQPRPCQTCHTEQVPIQSQQVFSLEVWDAPRTRTLTFEHAWHDVSDCSKCHQNPPLLEARACDDCHEDHHTGAAQCSVCHQAPPPGAHDVSVHRSCSGAGCHRERQIEAIATTRPVCLACHRAQVDHQPGGNCIDCHKIRGEPAALHDDGWSAYRSFSTGGQGGGR